MKNNNDYQDLNENFVVFNKNKGNYFDDYSNQKNENIDPMVWGPPPKKEIPKNVKKPLNKQEKINNLYKEVEKIGLKKVTSSQNKNSGNDDKSKEKNSKAP